ncbi:aminotransferase class I/II-fold pyridoxal phosphate-dependent enzyme [Stakelama flava]|nr:aminotransferase class I/II-fold pyridoxal phosphate-dependent enzyme [Stakelama flava]
MMQAESAYFSYHGGRMDAARRLYPHAPLPWLDLSTGINPLPWKPDAGLTIDHASLPDRQALAELEAAAAAHFGVAAERVAALPGSEMGLRMLPVLGLPQPLCAVTPGYGTQGEVAARRVPYGAVKEAARSGGTLLLANPNNPDGRVCDVARMLSFSRAKASAGGWLIVDEAFADAQPGISILSHLTDAAPVIVLRSFGKFFGLAGLRLGFVVAPPAILARVRAMTGDWPVSAEAIAWGTAAYRDARWIAATRQRLVSDADALDMLLARHGMTVRGECPLFRLAEHPAASDGLFDKLARRGILVRPFTCHPHWLRFGLPPDAAGFARLEAALADD